MDLRNLLLRGRRGKRGKGKKKEREGIEGKGLTTLAIGTSAYKNNESHI